MLWTVAVHQQIIGVLPDQCKFIPGQDGFSICWFKFTWGTQHICIGIEVVIRLPLFSREWNWKDAWPVADAIIYYVIISVPINHVNAELQSSIGIKISSDPVCIEIKGLKKNNNNNNNKSREGKEEKQKEKDRELVKAKIYWHVLQKMHVPEQNYRSYSVQTCIWQSNGWRSPHIRAGNLISHR